MRVWVTLDEPSVARFHSERLAAAGVAVQGRAASPRPAAPAPAAETLAQRERVRGQQDTAADRLKALGARELGRVQLAHNAVAVRVEASRLREIAALPGVQKVRPVIDYQLHLGETVPYIGAAKVHSLGFDGAGVRVAVIDGGVDYTHRNLGGPGTVAAYEAAHADPTQTDGLFPTAKVVAGHDFVGELWPDEEPVEDADPIDAEGHGTHVADIIAGRSADGRHRGVAPGASIVAIKACSAIAAFCDGMALLQAIDYALDPNRDGDIGDAVDVINLSVGTSYGQPEDVLSEAAATAVRLGVVVVASAGNAGNLPYVASSPSIAPGVISVAQTQVPSAQAVPLTISAPPAIAGSDFSTATLAWAPVGAGFSGTVAYLGTGCPGEGDYPVNPSGQVALIDRGSCNVSLKVDRAARAGAIGVVIGLVDAGDPAPFSHGGGDTFVPAIVVTQALAKRIKGHLESPVRVSLNPADALSIVGSMVASSARGPSGIDSSIKPEIGAPGAVLSAEVGSGDGETAFSGTSGAAPMVAGAAALLLERHPGLGPEQVKALLMNSADPDISTNPATRPGVLAPVSRIGAGELRVDRALALTSTARDPAAQSASLSFGFPSVTHSRRLTRRLLVENHADVAKVYSVKATYRSQRRGAVRLLAPGTIAVGPRGRAEVDVHLVIDAAALPDWTLDGGRHGGDGALLDRHEFDGHLKLRSGSELLSVPWHVLPRKSSQLTAWPKALEAGDKFLLVNLGAGDGAFDVFSLTGTSPRVPRDRLPGPGGSETVIDLRAVGVRLVAGSSPAADVVQFALNTQGRRLHPNHPALFEIDIDADRDGAADYALFNQEAGEFATDGRNAVFVYDAARGTFTQVAFADVDLNSANFIFTVPAAAVGLQRARRFDFVAFAIDNYFTGDVTDAIGPMSYTLGKPRYAVAGLPPTARLAPYASRVLTPREIAGGAAASPSHSGLLLMYRQDAGREADVVRLR